MITTEEIGSVAVFASLSEAEREQICRAAAPTMRLVQGITRPTKVTSARCSR